MAKLYITEFNRLKRPGSDTAQIGSLSTGTDQSPVVISGSSTPSAAFATDTQFIRVHTDAICSVAYGANPTATANSFRMAADQTEYFGVNPGDKIAVIANT